MAVMVFSDYDFMEAIGFSFLKRADVQKIATNARLESRIFIWNNHCRPGFSRGPLDHRALIKYNHRLAIRSKRILKRAFFFGLIELFPLFA